ncbi:3-oxoacyl-ACP reductase FabG [Amycolatopsis sp. NPDC026612]|uniref:SDR family NAD(P)-dependent oxidoreductase n=1 Tax=Amycolatopsis sp. NPDC026612 TaxID=3155466 RepID=UPI0033CB2AA7
MPGGGTGDLRERVALVTGGSRGIGRAVAVALAAAGAAVGVNYREGESAARAVVAEIAENGGTAAAIQGDVSDFDQAQAVVAKTVAEFGGLHVLVNNAGIARDALLFEMNPQDWLDVMNVNFGGVFNCTKAALPQFAGQRDGVIVNMSSMMGERGWTGEANYAASKGAINAFTRCAAVELARFGVRVNAVLPGFSPTDLVAGLLAKDDGRTIKRQVPQRRFAAVEDVAEATVFLAGPRSGHITGTLLPVDGGVGAQLGLGRTNW